MGGSGGSVAACCRATNVCALYWGSTLGPRKDRCVREDRRGAFCRKEALRCGAW